MYRMSKSDQISRSRYRLHVFSCPVLDDGAARAVPLLLEMSNKANGAVAPLLSPFLGSAAAVFVDAFPVIF